MEVVLSRLLPLGRWSFVVCLCVACSGAGENERSNTGAGGHAPCVECSQGGKGVESDGGAGAEASSAGSSGADDSGAGDSGGAPATGDGLALSEISFWQALRVPLELAGAVAKPNAPVILNKAGILRAYVTPDAGFVPRQLSAVLELGADTNVKTVESKKLIRDASEDSDFLTTFNFPIETDQVIAGAKYSITVRDGTGGRVLARFPSAGRSPLGAESVALHNTMQIVLVPIVVGGIEPNVSAPVVAKFRTRVLAMYPLADVTITLHPAVTSTVKVGPDKGWDELLDSVYALRAKDAPAANVFYYGLFTPTKTFDDYCTAACTVGYSIVAELSSEEDRGSLGLGIFADGSNSDAPDTMAHELGHALGRDHAPCETQDPGPFPYKGGKIGSWGFDPQNHKLLDPSVYGDVMGYCTPDWVSDFTYRGLFKRLVSVNAEVVVAKSAFPAAAPNAYQRVLLAGDGSLRWGSRFTSRRAPEGDVREVTLLGVDGSSLGSVAARVRRYGDAAGGFLLLPESVLDAAAGIAAIRVGNAVLTLPTR